MGEVLCSSDHKKIKFNNVAKEKRQKEFSTCIFNSKNGNYEKAKNLKNET